jgi:protein TonB
LAAIAFWTWQNSEQAFDWVEEKSSGAAKQSPHRPADQLPSAENRDVNRPRQARANLVAIFSTNDYPADAIRRNEQGTVGFELSINRLGWVSWCRIVRSSGSEALDRATCDILRSRARFEPARDASGRRVTDEYSGRIRWDLPEE